MSLRGAIASLEQGSPFTVTRTVEGSFDDAGVYTPGGTSTFTIVASIQPVTGRDLSDLIQGQQGLETRVIYTLTELRTRRAGNDPDSIEIDDEPWTVIRVERFDAFGETHYRAYAQRTESP